MKVSTERRAHKRLEREYRVVYSPLEGPESVISTRSFNISQGGLGLIARSHLDSGTRLKLSIYGNGGDGEPVRAEGVVRWRAGQKKGPAGFRAGISFKRVGWTRLKELLGE